MAHVNGINRKPAKQTAVVASLLVAVLITAGAILGQSAAQAQTADCNDWQRATESTEYLARGDLYRICDDQMQVLIVEDNDDTLVTYPASVIAGLSTIESQTADCGDWQPSTEHLAVGDLYRICGDQMQVLIVEDYHRTLVSYPAGVMAEQSASHAQSDDCGDWQRATKTTEHLALGDLYRICGDQMQVLIVEDEHRSLIEYPIAN